MNIRCPQCQTVFRVDPEKIPEKGVRARCARCTAVFALNRSGVVPTRPLAPTHSAAAVSAPVVTHAAASAAPAAAPPTAAPSAAPAAAVRPLPPMPAAPPAAAPASTGARPSFLKQDPNTRAQRLARALVADIVAYHRDKRDQTLAAGTLRTTCARRYGRAGRSTSRRSGSTWRSRRLTSERR
jgi:predicted Zn finger-like uncharacterized protein